MSKVDLSKVLSKFVHVLSATEEVEQEIQEAVSPFKSRLETLKAEMDAMATAIGTVSGPGTYKLPDGKLHKVRKYRKDDAKGRTGFYFLDFEEKQKGIKDLSLDSSEEDSAAE